MSDVSIENCVNRVGNKFKLVLLASCRAKSFMNGSYALYDGDKEKNYLVALKEIDDNLSSVGELEELAINTLKSQYSSKDAKNVDDVRDVTDDISVSSNKDLNISDEEFVENVENEQELEDDFEEDYQADEGDKRDNFRE